MKSPEISVIMSVFNTPEEYLKKSIESILTQTYKNFEFLIINDGSKDYINKILKNYNDDRIKIIYNKTNIGLTKSLNIGLKAAKGCYIARMDADDISMRDRLEKQYDYMENNHEIDILGTHAYILGTKKIIMRRVFHPNQEITRIRMLFYDAGFVHPSVFIRKKFLDNNELLYNEKIKKAQDYDLWVRSLQYGKLSLLTEPLLEYRIHNEQISKKSKDNQKYYSDMIKKEQLHHLDKNFSKKELDIHFNFLDETLYYDPNEIISYFKKLIFINNEKNIYNKYLFERELKAIWFQRMLKRLILSKKTEMIWNKFTLKALSIKNWSYLLEYSIGNTPKIKL